MPLLSAISNAAKQKLYWLKSRSIQFYTAMGGVWAVLPQLKENLPELQPYLPPAVFNVLGAATLIGVIYLRAITTQPLSSYKPEPAPVAEAGSK